MDNKLKLDIISQNFVKKELFFKWIRRFFTLNNELKNGFDSIYQNAFYVCYYELITEGLYYCNEVLTDLKERKNNKEVELFEEIFKGLDDMKSIFSISELQFIEYKRRSASHIFQSHYEKRFTEKGDLIDKRKGKFIDEITLELDKELLEKGFDSGFDKYMFNKINSLVTKLYNQLNK